MPPKKVSVSSLFSKDNRADEEERGIIRSAEKMNEIERSIYADYPFGTKPTVVNTPTQLMAEDIGRSGFSRMPTIINTPTQPRKEEVEDELITPSQASMLEYDMLSHTVLVWVNI